MRMDFGNTIFTQKQIKLLTVILFIFKILMAQRFSYINCFSLTPRANSITCLRINEFLKLKSTIANKAYMNS